MKKISLILVAYLSIVSCNKEDVQLPKADVSVMKELTDHSPIYMFYENDSIADVNKNNSISTTNWVFNIDKRLPLEIVIPEVMILQYKKKNSSHKKEGAINKMKKNTLGRFKKIVLEIWKCIILCSNCHAAEHQKLREKNEN